MQQGGSQDRGIDAAAEAIVRECNAKNAELEEKIQKYKARKTAISDREAPLGDEGAATKARTLAAIDTTIEMCNNLRETLRAIVTKCKTPGEDIDNFFIEIEFIIGVRHDYWDVRF